MLIGASPEAIGKESLDNIPDKLPADYHCAISHLQEITKLDFGKLAEADTYPKEEALQSKPFRRLEGFKGANWNIHL